MSSISSYRRKKKRGCAVRACAETKSIQTFSLARSGWVLAARPTHALLNDARFFVPWQGELGLDAVYRLLTFADVDADAPVQSGAVQ